MVKYSRGDYKMINKIYKLKDQELELFNLAKKLICIAIVFIVLGIISSRNSLLSSLFINLVASMITIIFIIYYVDTLLKKSEVKKKEEEEKLELYEEWKFEFRDDKQQISRYMGEISTMIDILTECYSERECTLEDNNKKPIIDLLKVKLRIKLANPPLRYSFESTDWMKVHDNKKNVENIVKGIRKSLNEIEEYINLKELTKDQLINYSRQLFRCRFEVLSLEPKKFEDIKDNIKL